MNMIDVPLVISHFLFNFFPRKYRLEEEKFIFFGGWDILIIFTWMTDKKQMQGFGAISELWVAKI